MSNYKYLLAVEVDDPAKYDMLFKLINAMPGVSAIVIGLTKKEANEVTPRDTDVPD